MRTEGWPSFEEREVIEKARALVARVKLARATADGHGWNATEEVQALCVAVDALDSGRLLLGHMPSGAPLYVGDGRPNIKPRYEPEGEPEELPQ